jgi:hypothetical protein
MSSMDGSTFSNKVTLADTSWMARLWRGVWS